MILNTVDAVEQFAIQAHAGQIDKIGEPYIKHVFAVARGLEPFGPDLVMAGLLHDVLEDTAYTARDLLQAQVPPHVVQAVVVVTNTPGTPYQDRIQRIIRNPEAVLVKIADNAHNSLSERAVKLPEEERLRLKRKYTRAREALWAAARPEDVRAIVSIVNPSLLGVTP